MRPDPSGLGVTISADITTLIFLPTYRSLEDLHGQLEAAQRRCGRRLQLTVLHSSIDIDECLRTIADEGSGDGSSVHKVILATNVAESSLTIPGVSTVIDYCRCNQIHWDVKRARSDPKTVWASQSQCDQRSGRTGRTCQGTVYRLLPTQVVFQRCVPTWEPPELTLSSLHEEMLLLTSSDHHSMHNASELMRTALDPPEDEVILAAQTFLVKLGALRLSGRQGRTVQEATPYGRALAALPLSLEGARIALRGMVDGQMRTTVLLGAIMSSTPAPILKPFGKQGQYEDNLKLFGGEAATPQDKAAGLMAQLTAYEWWQCLFVDAARLRRLGIDVAQDGSITTGSETLPSDKLCSICVCPLGAGGADLEPEPEPESDAGIRHSLAAAAAHTTTRLPCGHMFHRSCIQQWIAERPVCPMCRADVPDTALSNLDPFAGDKSAPSAPLTNASGASEESLEVDWCVAQRLVRTALRCVQETAIAATTALQALDLDLLYESRNLKPEAWRTSSDFHDFVRESFGGATSSGEDKITTMLSVSTARLEEKKLLALLKNVLSNSANKVMEISATDQNARSQHVDMSDSRALCSKHTRNPPLRVTFGSILTDCLWLQPSFLRAPAGTASDASSAMPSTQVSNHRCADSMAQDKAASSARAARCGTGMQSQRGMTCASRLAQ